MKNSTKSALLMALLFITACKRESTPKPVAATDPTPSSSKLKTDAVSSAGSAVFTRFISIGDSQTAGYTNDGLYNAGMGNSFPNIFATQLKTVGLPSFTQALFSDVQKNGTGFIKSFVLSPDGFPVSLTRETTQLGLRGSINIPGFGSVPLLSKYVGTLDNYGIVGLRIADINNPLLGNVNSYLERLLPANSPTNTAQYIDFITSQPFSFFTLNLGANDVLGYALQGGTDISLLTDNTVFNTNYEALVTRLTAGGAKGVLTTIPDINSIAFFNVIKPSLIVAKTQTINPAFNKLYISARLSSTESWKSYVTREATDNDHIVLTFNVTKVGTLVSTSNGMQPYGLSPFAPIENQWVLDVREALIVSQHITAYNTSIRNIAAAKSLALFNANGLFNILKTPTTIQDVTISTAYLTGGLFSLDGVHLTPRGNALAANYYIDATKKQYGSAISSVRLSAYSAN